MPKTDRSLLALARAYRVTSRYRDGFRQWRTPPPESLLLVLRELGAPVEKLSDAPDALRQRRAEIWRERLAPVIVAFGGERPVARLRLARQDAAAALDLRVQLEEGGQIRERIDMASLRWPREVEVDGQAFSAALLPLPEGLPVGYHRLRVRAAGWVAESWLLIAPEQCPAAGADRPWGVFAPLYSLSSEASLGAASFSDLAAFPANVPGGGFAGTLPLLAAFLDQPFAPSPYTPVSRLFWNEFYVDPLAPPEATRSTEVRAIVEAPETRQAVAAWKAAKHVDYSGQMMLRRMLLWASCRSLCARPKSARFQAYAARLAGGEELRAYGMFRAAVERRFGQTWQAWPETWRKGRLPRALENSDEYRYHTYVQWLAEEQLGHASSELRKKGAGLYLDLPLGVHPGGFDVWREPDSFALGMNGGAPPDRFFTQGQNWGFAPMHPERVRHDAYSYFRRCLKRHMQFSGVLRIDHVMGLSRFFWVPRDRPASEGVYVQSRPAELFAVLSIEAQRSGAAIVGEDLGTVSASTRNAMERHRVYRMSVAQFGFSGRKASAVSAVPADALACLNTHDMRPFAGYWHGDDIDDQLELGLIEKPEATRLRRARARTRRAVAAFLVGKGLLARGQAEPAAVALALLEHLAASDADFLLVNLEDLVGERESQNTPGTTTQRENWTRRARFRIEDLFRGGELAALLERVEKARRAG